MSERAWQDMIVGDRMRVDEAFAPTVEQSGFSRSEWGMIMTAVEFEVVGEGDDARLVADTSQVDVIMPELEKVTKRMGGPPSGASGTGRSTGFGGGLVDSIRSSLGMGGGADPERRDEAIRLAEQYARKLQDRLEERGRWERIREMATKGTESAAEP